MIIDKPIRAANTLFRQLVAFGILTLSRRSRRLARNLSLCGDVATYGYWLRESGLDVRLSIRREHLWNHILDKCQHGPVYVLEYGVAWGYTTNYFLTQSNNPNLRWFGFDTFRGLPQDWMRGMITHEPRGAFDAGGLTPNLSDPRLTWVIGECVARTRDLLELDEFTNGLRNSQIVLILDLDLFQPTSEILKMSDPYLKAGDLVLFDEAFDPYGERQLLINLLQRRNHDSPMAKLVGVAGNAALVEIVTN